MARKSIHNEYLNVDGSTTPAGPATRCLACRALHEQLRGAQGLMPCLYRIHPSAPFQSPLPSPRRLMAKQRPLSVEVGLNGVRDQGTAT